MNLEHQKIEYEGLGERLKAYRLIKGMTPDELAENTGLKRGTIARIESGHQYSSMNQYWAIVKAEQLSVPWFFYGEGKYDDECPEFMPETIIRHRGAGIRRGDDRVDAESGQFTGDPFEFVLAVEAFKRLNNKPFPTWTEIYELIISLGYRKVEKQTIRPYNALRKSNDSSKSNEHSDGPVRETALIGSGTC